MIDWGIPANLEPWRIQLVGWLATASFALCYIPQLLHTFKTKKVEDISIWQWVIQLFGYFAGVGYACALQQWPLFVGYLWGAAATAVFMSMYFWYRRGK